MKKILHKKKLLLGLSTGALLLSFSTAALAAYPADAPLEGHRMILGEITEINAQAMTIAPVEKPAHSQEASLDYHKGQERNRETALETTNESQDQADFSYHKGQERNRVSYLDGEEEESPNHLRKEMSLEPLECVVDEDTQVFMDGEKGSIDDLETNALVKVFIDENQHVQTVFAGEDLPAQVES